MKKSIAFMLATVMAVAAPITSFAAAEGAGQIFYQDVTNVVAPTNLLFAMNPQKLEIGMNGAHTTDQIISNNIGIYNKSNNGKFVTMKLSLDMPEGITLTTDGGVQTDITSKRAATSMSLRLTAATSGSTLYAIEGASAFVTTNSTAITSQSTQMANMTTVNATTALTDSDVNTLGAIAAGASNGADFNLSATEDKYFTFVLSKAAYEKVTSGAGLGNTTVNDVKDLYRLAAADPAAAQYTAFRFDGIMNEYGNWKTIGDNTIGITVVYDTTKNWYGDAVVTENGTAILTTNAAADFKANFDSGSYALEVVEGTGNLRYTFASPVSGDFTAVKVNGMDKPGLVGTNIKLNDAKTMFIVQKQAVDNPNLNIVEGNTVIIATIGGVDYKFTY